MYKVLYTLFLGIFLSPSHAQHFTFSDTYPTNNVDSLENWLKTHPQLTEERLKNLIRLERTYGYMFLNRLKRHTTEITRLSQRLNHPVGKIFGEHQNSATIKDKLKILGKFEALKDTSGIIYVLTSLVYSNYDVTLLEKGDRYAAKNYLLRAKQLLSARFNPHDYLDVVGSEHFFLAGKPDGDNKAIIRLIKAALHLCENNPQYQYAVNLFKGFLAVTYYYQQDYAASYALNKAILARLKPDQINEIITRTQNLANDCEFLGRYDERLALSRKVAKLIRYNPNTYDPFDLLNLYISFKEEMARRGRYKEALSYADSIIMIQDTIYVREREQKLIEFQAENKQKQIAELTLEQVKTANRNRFILTLLGIAVVVALVLGYLGLRLRQANTHLHNLTKARDQLFGIVAHDLRRPMYAFQGIKALIGFHLRRQNYTAIEQLSVAIDESGVRLQKMLDNLVAWAMSQQESLPYEPEPLPVYERVQDIVDLYAGVNILKNVRFEIVVDKNLMAYVDPNAFDLIVRNLIDNSFKALSQAGNLRISAKVQSPAIVLEFTDDAGGIPARKAAVIQRVFDAPQKAQIGQDGMGMGLITVGRFVKRNRGSISVRSVEGKGTTFEVRLPAENII
ncbi:sensor histidine kinase [Runella slithyformis]|uniref:histidine kinase n=1 Tax=Runella slithyformis (strain ATCC 29530 / DSM 19594 / LMG 11500 / NCIMB 11436 / LSU 4) TaxID=761193 RepID=A0A7U3ZM49_RUNSL|nr:HAMP domain-containing sensor histidine kinase [Runella slithyformis]AEI49740.1 histidine kinase [Runella slithyformis DSM 19594]